MQKKTFTLTTASYILTLTQQCYTLLCGVNFLPVAVFIGYSWLCISHRTAVIFTPQKPCIFYTTLYRSVPPHSLKAGRSDDEQSRN